LWSSYPFFIFSIQKKREIFTHRSGLISAIWEYAVEGKSAQEASRQLSLFYGHFPYLGNRTKAMDESFWRFVNECEESKQKSKIKVTL